MAIQAEQSYEEREWLPRQVPGSNAPPTVPSMSEPVPPPNTAPGLDPVPPRARFRPHERVRDRAVFQQVFAQRRAVSDAHLIVHAMRNGLAHARLGITVPRRVTRSAVARNRLKRLIREAFRLRKAELPVGFDLIVLPRRTGVDAGALTESLVRLARDAVRRAPPGPAP